ncbi:exo-1,3-beta-glucanase [Neocucurbitaria cava]|uniref:Exo-1,3-beta-glucanase n=1 Tax=Neocucurbitaria cava TaxID=798079 RepID=A0A9W9CRB5_9PLEO|nr:exo-1,3-beta-glucanase [Neocucurbitaria cava]
MTQLIGNPKSLPVLKAAPTLDALALIDASPYSNQNGAPGWISTNLFMRQIRNLVIDGTAVAPTKGFQGIHWPASQATTIQNVKIRMTQSSDSVHAGIFVENGSGGHMADLEIEGGEYGMNIGNQQFTMRNIKISKAVIGISQIWNWGWLYSGLSISDCGTAFSMINGYTSNKLEVGSVVIIDSEITNCPRFVDMAWKTNSVPIGAGQLTLENIKLTNVPIAVMGSGATILAGGTLTIQAWGQGNKYSPNGPVKFQGPITAASRPAGLLDGGKYYSKSKPQYETLTVSNFVSARGSGATGDGSTDDTKAVQNAINTAVSQNKVLFFEHGVYKVTQTIYVPPGARMVGETFSVIMGSGSTWSNMANPAPIVQIGKSGESGSIEWSDMIVQTQGATPGAVVIEYNLNSARGSGLWDVHTRIGGAKAQNVFAGFIQTETPYYMPSPDAKTQPYGRSDTYSDPNYATACTSGICDAYGLRVLNSKSILIYGGGLYSFFKNYDVSCSSPDAANGFRNCQTRIFSIEGASSVQAFALSEVGAEQMLTIDGVDKAKWSDNLSVYSNTIGYLAYNV